MIRLVSLEKSYPTDRGDQKVILRRTTASLPCNRRMAVLGRHHQGKSVLLRLLSGTEQPSRGAVLSANRLSPIFRRSALFNPQLSLRHNVRFYSRLLGYEFDGLMMAIANFCGHAEMFDPNVKIDNLAHRFAAEVAVLSLIPFDCYLIDEIGQVDADHREKFFDAGASRGAGFIFATKYKVFARQYADCAVVVRDGALYSFSDVEEGIAFNEQR